MSVNQRSFQIGCPQCKKTIVVTIARIGETITCDYCLEEFEVRRPQADSPSNRDGGSATDASAGSGSLEFDDEPDLQSAADDLSVPLPEDRVADTHPKQADVDELDTDYEFAVACPLCSTRLSATDVQIGTKIQCPDCFSSFEIRTPPKRARRKPTGSPSGDDDAEFRLSDPVERPKYEPLGSTLDGLGAEPPETGPPGDQDPPAAPLSPATDAMRRAEQEADEADRAARKLPAQPLTSGTLTFLLDVNTLVRMVVLAVVLQIDAAAAQAALDGMAGSGLAKVAALLLFLFSAALGLLFFVGGSVSMLAITQESAGGNDCVETWPGLDVTEWFVESLHLALALFVGFLPGLVIGQVFMVLGTFAYGWGLVVTCALSVLTLSPILLMASLETGLPLNFASAPVFRSLSEATPHWLRFFLLSFGLAIAAGVLWQIRHLGSLPLNFVASLAVVAIAMIYFRMLGRLVWICQESSPQKQ